MDPSFEGLKVYTWNTSFFMKGTVFVSHVLFITRRVKVRTLK